MAWTTTDLLASIKRRAGVPFSQATFTPAEVLTIASEELMGYIVPLVTGIREDHWLVDEDVTLTPTDTYRIPYRAAAGRLRELSIIDASGSIRNIPRVGVDDKEDATWGFTVEGDRVKLINDGAMSMWRLGVTLRFTFTVRPNSLIETTAAGVVQSFSTGAKTITLASAPAGFTGNTSWDIIRARSPFEFLGYDLAGTLATATITFTNALPTDLMAGDYVCLREQSPVPQLPVELHPLLAQKVAIKILESIHDEAALDSAREELGKLEKDAKEAITPRVIGEAKTVVNRDSLYRSM
jgi:hypothetical protein